MFTTNQISSICAALQYWKDEMCPHGREAMEPYFEKLPKRFLSSVEVTELQSQLLHSSLLFGVMGDSPGQLQTEELFRSERAARAATKLKARVVAVIVPGDVS